jgi:hypothetical protein
MKTAIAQGQGRAAWRVWRRLAGLTAHAARRVL